MTDYSPEPARSQFSDALGELSANAQIVGELLFRDALGSAYAETANTVAENLFGAMLMADSNSSDRAYLGLLKNAARAIAYELAIKEIRT